MNLAAEYIEVENRAVLASLLRRAHDADRGVLVAAGHGDPARDRNESELLRLGLGRLREVLHHDPGDQSISVEPGLRVTELQSRLARDGQMLAVEAPDDTLTIGDLFMQGRESFCAYRHGPLRDQVLGVTVLLPDGRVCRSGGRVAKNVTGYDLTRLHCGGRGQFGVPVEISFRLRPRPATTKTFVLGAADEAEATARGQIIRGFPHRISALVAVGGSVVVREDAWLLALRVEGSAGSLRDIEARLRDLAPGLEELDESEARGLWRELSALRPPSGHAPEFVDFAWPRSASAVTPADTATRTAIEERLRRVFDPRGVLQRSRWPRGIRP